MLPIAWITLRRIAEKAVLVQFGILALVLMYVGLGLDAIIMTDASEQSGLAVTWLFLSMFTVFWSTIEIPRELSRKEVHVYLSKPVTRLRYLIGKYIGMTGMVLAGEVLLLSVFAVCLVIKGHPPSEMFLFGAARIGLFLALLNAMCALASVLMAEVPAMVSVLIVAGVGVMAFALPVLAWSSYDALRAIGMMAGYYVVPNLLHFRWEPTGGGLAPYFLTLTGYTAGWVTILIVITWAFFVRKDLP